MPSLPGWQAGIADTILMPAPQAISLVGILAQLAPILISFAVMVIAWQQWIVSRNKLRLDLFDRRYKVYDATRTFLAAIMSDTTFEDRQLFAFYAGTSDAGFLFGRDIVQYLGTIRERRALEMRKCQKLYEPMPVGDERSRLVEAEHDALLWLTDQLTAMTKTFSPYLSFRL